MAASYLSWRLSGSRRPGPPTSASRPASSYTSPVFAGQHDQARANQWQDLARPHHAPRRVFAPFVAKTSTDTLWLYQPGATGCRQRGTHRRQPS
ncbi:MAG: hypothetical protein WKF73_03605 [Nocardioidaceae bacterium]